MDWKARSVKFQQDIPAVFVALKHKETPFRAKLMAVLIVSYALSPIDFIPDFIPVVGLLDDLILLPLMVILLVRFIPSEMMEEYRKEAEGLSFFGKKKKWIYAIPFIVIWIGLLWLLFCVAT